MELQYKNKEEELVEFYKYLNSKEKVLNKYMYFKAFALIPVCIVISIFIYLSRQQIIEIHSQFEPEDIVAIVAPIIVAIAWSIIYLIFSRLFARDRIDNKIKNMEINFEEDVTLKLTEEILEYKIEGSVFNFYLNNLTEAVDKKDTIYLVFNNSYGVVVPVAAFEEDKEKQDFLNKINKK